MCSKLLDVKEGVLLRDIDQERKKINLSQEREKTIKEKPKKISSNLKRKKYEEEIIRILLNYGNEEITYGEEKFSICRFIFNELKSDNIEIVNEPHKKIYHELKELINQKKQFHQSYFISHNDNEIHKLCVDLLADKHIISENWALRHKIYTSIESQNLKKTAEKSVLMLKLQHVEDEIKITSIIGKIFF